jgi:hypothetical protein
MRAPLALNTTLRFLSGSHRQTFFREIGLSEAEANLRQQFGDFQRSHTRRSSFAEQFLFFAWPSLTRRLKAVEFVADSRTSSISPANLSVAALPVVPLAVLPGADGEADVAVFVLARVALRCPERCEPRTRKEGDLGWRDRNDGSRWTRSQ